MCKQKWRYITLRDRLRNSCAILELNQKVKLCLVYWVCVSMALRVLTCFLTPAAKFTSGGITEHFNRALDLKTICHLSSRKEERNRDRRCQSKQTKKFSICFISTVFFVFILISKEMSGNFVLSKNKIFNIYFCSNRVLYFAKKKNVITAPKTKEFIKKNIKI